MPYFSRCGRQLYFTDTAGSGEPVLLLHGLGSRGEDWEPQVAALAHEFRVLTLDFAGHGRSSPAPGDMTMALLAADVQALLDHLELPRVHVAGLSLGGMVAFQLLAFSPERLRSLIVINSGPGMAHGRWRLKMLIALRVLLIHGLGLPALAARIAPKLFPRDSQQELRDRFQESVALADKQTYLNILRGIGRFNVWPHIADSAVPALILAADNDYTPVAYKSAYTATLANAQLCVIEHSGHASPMDAPDQCNEKILVFLHSHLYEKESAIAETTAD